MGGRGLTAAVVVGATALAACGGDAPTVEALPRAVCAPIITASGAEPDLLVVADMPRRGRAGVAGVANSEAVRLALEAHDFRAGAHVIGFQECDDSTAAAGGYDQKRCATNGSTYAGNAAVVGVIGPLHSLCAKRMVPEASRAGLAVISPSATLTSLTAVAAGASPQETLALYPTGQRTFFRVAPPDSEQAGVAVALLRRLGVERLFVAGEPTEYGASNLAAVRADATRAGIDVLASETWNLRGARVGRLVRRARAAGADGAHLSGAWQNGGAQLATALRAEMGADFPLVGTDGFVLGLPPAVSRAADGMWVTVAGLPPRRLPPAGREVVRAVGTGPPPTLGSPYAAAATELLVRAIAGSDGTRGDVVRELRRVQVSDGPVGPLRFDANGDPIPRHVFLYRMRDGAVLPEGD